MPDWEGASRSPTATSRRSASGAWSGTPFGDDLRSDLFGGSGAPGATQPAPAPLELVEEEPLELVEEAGA